MKYRYHWLFKLLALVLAAVAGASLILGCAGLILDDLGYYERSRWGQTDNEVWQYSRRAAEAVFDHYAWKDTGIEPKLFERFFRWGADVDAAESLEHDFHYIIRSQSGKILEGTFAGDGDWEWCDIYEFDVRRGFVTEMPKAECYPEYGVYENGRPVYTTFEGEPLPELNPGVTDCEYYVVSDNRMVNPQNISMDHYLHADAKGADYTIYRMEYTGYDSYRVEIYLTAGQKAAIADTDLETEFLPRLLKQHHDLLVPMVAWGGIVLLMAILWLALTAGGSPHREGIDPRGLNLIPLDLYLGLAAVGCVGLVGLTGVALDGMVWDSGWGNYDGIGGMETFLFECTLLGLMGAAAGGGIALFFMACAAQMKKGDKYWLKHTCLGLCWRYGWKFLKTGLIWCRKALKVAVRWVRSFFRGILRAGRRFADLLPLTWQWLLVSGGLWILMLVCCIHGIRCWEPGLILFGAALTAGVVFYAAWCFGQLRDGARKMSGGDLEEKIESKYLLGTFGEFAGHLNTLGDTCVEAAKQQMKSERMKSELITNVSHDIKTPLTSIINYVDLLQKTEDESERREYLEVLDRQSQRLKKLIEDLMDMSRANSGNMAVEITPTDVGEAVNQALGEFADTLDRCGLTVMLKMPPEPCTALCDGRHLWRVLSNTLGNVVKYAMPGTRVYVDVERRGAKVEVSVKNISARMLNISAEELMERFVRGDAARNTEGNGLGLNIAKSLMELQGGKLDLVVDGDLFKVILTLNAA